MDLSKYSVKHITSTNKFFGVLKNWRLLLFIKPGMHLMSKKTKYEYILKFNDCLNIDLVKQKDIKLKIGINDTFIYLNHWQYKTNAENKLHLIENIAYKYQQQIISLNKNLYQNTIKDNNIYNKTNMVKKNQISIFNNIAYFLYINRLNDTYFDEILENTLNVDIFPLSILSLKKLGYSQYIENMLLTLIENELQQL